MIHPQSVIHSLVEYVDGSVHRAALAIPTCARRSPTRSAYPERIDSGARPLDLAAPEAPRVRAARPERFPCLGLACEALRAGGTAPAVLNAANEVAVEAFLAGRIRFTAHRAP